MNLFLGILFGTIGQILVFFQIQGSLKYQLNNILAQTGITVNVDYSDYANFIHFSSAQTRLENFYYKLYLLHGCDYHTFIIYFIIHNILNNSLTMYVNSVNVF